MWIVQPINKFIGLAISSFSLMQGMIVLSPYRINHLHCPIYYLSLYPFIVEVTHCFDVGWSTEAGATNSWLACIREDKLNVLLATLWHAELLFAISFASKPMTPTLVSRRVLKEIIFQYPTRRNLKSEALKGEFNLFRVANNCLQSLARLCVLRRINRCARNPVNAWGTLSALRSSSLSQINR